MKDLHQCPFDLVSVGPVKVKGMSRHEYTGDVMSDLNSKRAHILGMEPSGEGTTVIQAQVPMREMGHYAAALRSITQGRGLYTMRMEGYEEVPHQVAQQIIAEAQAQKDHR